MTRADQPEVLLDCRWLGYTGVGRVTAAVLDGLREAPSDAWAIWAPPAAREGFGAEAVHVSNGSPLALGGQRHLFSVPPARTIVYLHAVRPMNLWRRSVVLVHDVIPMHHEGSLARRSAWRAYLTASVRSAKRVMVYSEATEREVVDLGVPLGRVRRIPIPLNEGLVEQISARRALGGRSDPPQMVYVGQLKPHKNLERALSAFARSDFSARGGGFTIIGPRPDQCADLHRMVDEHSVDRVTVVPRCSDERLVAEMAGAAFVILPSLEEGFGLPVAESLAARIPVCCSGQGALLEASRGFAETFDPRSITSITEAIDRTAELDGTDQWSRRADEFGALPRPTTTDLVRAVRWVVEDLR